MMRKIALIMFGIFALFTGVNHNAYAEDRIGIEALQKGGYVIYFRHGATTYPGIDRLEWPRERQRLLSEKGIKQSEIIGKAFKENNIPVGEVLASPFYRCRDMAEIAFGRVDEDILLIGLLSDSEGRPARIQYLTEKVTMPPKEGTNRVIVAHRSNIEAVAGVFLQEGEAIVLQPNDTDTGFTKHGTFMPKDW